MSKDERSEASPSEPYTGVQTARHAGVLGKARGRPGGGQAAAVFLRTSPVQSVGRRPHPEAAFHVHGGRALQLLVTRVAGAAPLLAGDTQPTLLPAETGVESEGPALSAERRGPHAFQRIPGRLPGPPVGRRRSRPPLATLARGVGSAGPLCFFGT